KGLDREELWDVHAPHLADAAEIVAHEVHDHQVLGAVLRRAGEQRTLAAILLGVRGAWPRALDRAALHPALGTDAQEALGRAAGGGRVGERDQAGEGRRVPRAERSGEREGARREWRLEPAGEAGLVHVAGGDAHADLLDRLRVALRVEEAVPGECRAAS